MTDSKSTSEIIVEELDYIDIVFDDDMCFIEIENSNSENIEVGTWIKRDDGFWALRLTDLGFDKE